MLLCLAAESWRQRRPSDPGDKTGAGSLSTLNRTELRAVFPERTNVENYQSTFSGSAALE